MARPIADSEAAIVNTNSAKNCPKKSSKKTEKINKFKLIERSISSIEISSKIKCFLIKKKPHIDKKNKTQANTKNLNIN